ncbi:MAG: MFS transporter [Pirellulales bacterium]
MTAPANELVEQPADSAGRTAHTRDTNEITRLSDLTGVQWRSGIAAWLGWLFDGLDMHLYTLVALPFVAELLATDAKDPRAGTYSSIIQASFLVGWALGGGFFGRIGDRLGRSRALILTILTYAVFTGLSAIAQQWWHLLIFRFLAALGIGGEWAVGAALLSETWPRRWRPWLAAVLQTAVNVGVLVASLAALAMAQLPYRYVFLVGILPALLTLWIRRAVPETEEWHTAQQSSGERLPGVFDLFRGSVRRTTLLTLTVCALGLTGHWAFMFWSAQDLRNLPDVAAWSDAERTGLVSRGVMVIMISSIVGNFIAAALARRVGYRLAIVLFFLAYFAAMTGTYYRPRTHHEMWLPLALLGASSGVFALFTMYMPPLFPTLLRTTGAGFCYNFGRIAAAAGTVAFGLLSTVGDFRMALFCAGFLFLPAAGVALLLSEPPDERGVAAPVE